MARGKQLTEGGAGAMLILRVLYFDFKRPVWSSFLRPSRLGEEYVKRC
jgi:hypothetical protein